MRAVPRPLHRTPKRRQRQTVVLQIHQLPIGKPPGFRPCVLLLKGIPGLRRRRGRHDGSFVPLIRAALIAEPFPPGGQKLSALCAARPWIFVSDIRSFHPLRAKVESSAGVEPAPSRRAAGAHPHAPAAHIGGLFFPGTPSASGIGPHYKTRREGDSNPTMPPGGCLISPCGRVLSHPARRPRHRVAACVQYRTSLSRRMILFSVTNGRLPDFYDSQESWFRSLFQSLPDVRFTLRLASAEYVQSALSHHLPHIGTSFVVLIPHGRSVPAVMRN